jgi:predicted transcriptional regulator
MKNKGVVAKELYIKGLSLENIASLLGVTKRTIQNYKAKAKDWDELRAKNLLKKGGDTLYSSFLEAMNDFLKEIKDSDLKPDVKAEKISQIGDAFSKMKKVASYEDPEIFKHGIIKETIKTILLNAQKKGIKQECLEELVELIELIEEELVNVSI